MYPLLAALLMPLGLVWGLSLFNTRFPFRWTNVCKLELSVLFLLIGVVGHLLYPESVVELIPSWFPLRLFSAYATGVLEIAFAILLWTRHARSTGLVIIIYLILVLPFNIYGWTIADNSINYLDNPSYLWLRIPLQALFIAFAYVASRPAR